MKHQRQLACVVAMLAFGGFNAPAQTVMFSDQDFNDSDWTAELIVNEVGGSAKVQAMQDPRGGNPGAFRRIKHEGETKSSRVEIHVAHLRGGAVYNASESGGISSIAYSYDLKNLESRTVWHSTYYLLIFQNNSYYRSPRDRISKREWTPFDRSSLGARDFTRVAGDGPRRPNFSENAPPLQFGFASVSDFPASGGEVSPGLGGDGDDSRNSGIDNWSVVVSAAARTALTVTSDSALPAGMVGQPYAEALSAVGGVPPYAWSVVLGALPPELTLDPMTGSLQGNPAAPGTFRFVALATDTTDGAAAKEFVTRIELDPGVEPRLGARPNRLTFSFVQASLAATKKLSVLNEGGGSLGFQVETTTEAGGPWLLVSPRDGQATAAEPGMLNVTADPASLAPGTYFGEIQIASPSAQQSTAVPVAMAISSRSQLLRLSQRGLTFTAVAGGAGAPVQKLHVFNDGLGMMPWDIRWETLSGGDWLSVTPATGASEPSFPATVDVAAISSQGLSPGAYYGLLDVAAPDAASSPQFTTVVLNLLDGDRNPGPIVDPLGLIFAWPLADPAPSPQSFRIINLTNLPIGFALRGLTLTGDGWLSPATAEGTVNPGEPTNIAVEVLPEGLDAGIYRGLLRLQFDGELTRTVEVLLVVSRGAAISLKLPTPISQGDCSRTEVAPVFKVLGGTSPIPAGWPASIEVEVVDNCADKMTEGSVVVDFANIAFPSLALGHTGSGLWTGTWSVPSAAPESMAVVTVSATDPGGIGGSVSQALTVSPNPSSPPRVAPGGVVHSASFVTDPLAPGTIVSIFGSNLSSEPVSSGGRSANSVPLPTELAGTQLILGGRPLPILFSREDQVPCFHSKSRTA